MGWAFHNLKVKTKQEKNDSEILNTIPLSHTPPLTHISSSGDRAFIY